MSDAEEAIKNKYLKENSKISWAGFWIPSFSVIQPASAHK